MTGATLVFEFESPADEDRFLRDYLVNAWERFETIGVSWFRGVVECLPWLLEFSFDRGIRVVVIRHTNAPR